MLEAYESIFAYRQKEYIERQGFSGTGNLAMRRATYDAVGPFAGIEVAEDRDWGRRAGRKGYKIQYVPGMIAFHPARREVNELYEKWDRHVSHDFAEQGGSLAKSMRWTLRALAVGCSPIFETRRILASPRVPTWRERLMAGQVLVKIRFHRARSMLAALLSEGRKAASQGWNRE